MLGNDAVEVPDNGALNEGPQLRHMNGLQEIVPGCGLHGLVDIIEVIVSADHAEYGLHPHGTQMLCQLIAPVVAQVDIQQGNVGLKVHGFAHSLGVGGGGQDAGDVV